MAHKPHNEGSALLISLVIMGILLTLSLGISELILGGLRDSQKLLEKLQAWYAAEAGVEHGLLDIATHAPGYEGGEQKAAFEKTPARYNYKLTATSTVFPVRREYEIQTEADKYATLRLNESVTIPLFRGPGLDDTVKHLRVDYFLTPDLSQGAVRFDYKSLDVLRWKIFGLNTAGKMEVINEFVPANGGNSAYTPTCMGTNSDCWNGSKFYQLGPDGYELIDPYPIEKFLGEHTQNILVLTNIVNVDLIGGTLSPADKEKIATIRYRVTDQDGQSRLTLPSVAIAADGLSGDTIQSLNIAVQRETFLPVFNYALYRTVEQQIQKITPPLLPF